MRTAPRAEFKRQGSCSPIALAIMGVGRIWPASMKRTGQIPDPVYTRLITTSILPRVALEYGHV
jgi:hypothetical protein